MTRTSQRPAPLASSLAWAPALALAALLLPAAGPAPSPGPAPEPREGPVLRVEWVDGTVEDGVLAGSGEDLVLRTAAGERPLADGALLAWSTDPGAAPPVHTAGDPSDLLFLTAADGRPGAGDRLRGRLTGGDDEGLLFELDGGVPVAVSFDHLERLLPAVDRPVDRLLALEAHEFDDRLWRRRDDGGLDGVTGVVLELDGRTLVLDTAFAEDLALPTSAVSSLLLAPAGAGGPWRLAELDPVEVEEWPSLGDDVTVLYPWQRELSVSGGPLLLDGLLRTTGLGVHANARLAYRVPEGASRLRVTVGLVDEVLDLPAVATVSFEVLVDGESRADTGVVTEGEPARVLRVDGLRGGQLIELVTRDGGDLDAGDRAAWVDGVFLR